MSPDMAHPRNFRVAQTGRWHRRLAPHRREPHSAQSVRSCLGTLPRRGSREPDFARPQRPASAADQRHDGSQVVRGPEGPAADERACGERPTRGRVDTCDREGLVGVERGQKTGEPLGQHRLARTRWPDHQEMVRAGGRHLEGAPAESLAPGSPDDNEITSCSCRRLLRRQRLGRGTNLWRPGLTRRDAFSGTTPRRNGGSDRNRAVCPALSEQPIDHLISLGQDFARATLPRRHRTYDASGMTRSCPLRLCPTSKYGGRPWRQ